MDSRLKLLGHPIHPVLVTLPIGLFTAGLIFDLLYMIGNDPVFAQAAFWVILLGVVGGLAAAVFGLLDWLTIPGGTRAKRVGLVHGAGNAVIVLLFLWNLWLRVPDSAYQPDVLPFLLTLLGIGIALVTAWLGGELVYRLHVGVDADAHLDATSSLQEGLVSREPPRVSSEGDVAAPR
jgi:uncharacterized membrane protein